MGAALELFDITEQNIFLNNRLFESLGILGSLFQLVLTINAVLLFEALVLAIPLFFVVRDLKRTAKRFGLTLDPSALTGEKEDAYNDAASEVFWSGRSGSAGQDLEPRVEHHHRRARSPQARRARCPRK